MVNSSSDGRFFITGNHHVVSSEEWIEPPRAEMKAAMVPPVCDGTMNTAD
jgi:hypothetical protein